MHVSDVMTSPVIGIEPSVSINDAAQLMISNHFSGLPVINADKQLVGIVTESDFMRRGELGTEGKRPRWLELLASPGKEADEYVHAYGRRVEEVMTLKPVTISVRASLDEIVALMTNRRIKRVLVVDQGQLVGIVARSDLMRAMLRLLPSTASGAEDDGKIGMAIARESGRRPWGTGIRVKVEGGIAELSGVIFEEQAREAARVSAENVPGVKEVVDHLVFCEPISGMYLLPYDVPHA